jgi:hypothetical protein
MQHIAGRQFVGMTNPKLLRTIALQNCYVYIEVYICKVIIYLFTNK